MKNLQPFNTGTQILSYFEFKEWKKAKSLFAVPEFMENFLIGIAGISTLVGAVVLAGTGLVGFINNFSEVSFLWSLYAFLPVIFLMAMTFSTELLRSVISLKYKNKMMQKMNDNLLKRFVHTLLNDSYSSERLTNISSYDELIFASSQDKEQMIELAYNCMEEFDSSYKKKVIEEENARLKKEKQKIIEDFRSGTMNQENVEPKFQFMD